MTARSVKTLAGILLVDILVSTSVYTYAIRCCQMNPRLLFVTLVLLISTTVTHAEIASLCDSHEHTLWSCQSRSKIYSVCASQNLKETTGYLQYRAGTEKDIAFRFPDKALHPNGYFEFELLARGASLSFSNGDYTYSILESLMGESTIEVEKAGRLLSTVTCQAWTDSLTLTETINLFDRLGIRR